MSLSSNRWRHFNEQAKDLNNHVFAVSCCVIISILIYCFVNT